MPNIVNGLGQVKLGFKPTPAPPTQSTLMTSIYAVYNADGNNNLTVKNAWNANGNAVDSKSGVNGTIAQPSGTSWVAGTMTYGSGKLGSGAFTFNGSNFVSLPADSLKFTGDYSISMWVYIPSSVTSDPRYNSVGVPLINAFDNKAGYTNYYGWSISWYNNLIYFSSNKGSLKNQDNISIPFSK